MKRKNRIIKKNKISKLISREGFELIKRIYKQEPAKSNSELRKLFFQEIL